MNKPRKKHTSTFKAQVALEAIKEQATVADLARRYKVNANLVHKWKKDDYQCSARIVARCDLENPRLYCVQVSRLVPGGEGLRT